MNKKILLLFCLVLFNSINIIKVQAQIKAFATVTATIIDVSNTAQVNYVNGNSQIFWNSNIQNMASFMISGEDKNLFSIHLPSHPIILRNSQNANTLEVIIGQSSVKQGRGKNQKNKWFVNLDAAIIKEPDIDTPKGDYSGTYIVTFIYS